MARVAKSERSFQPKSWIPEPNSVYYSEPNQYYENLTSITFSRLLLAQRNRSGTSQHFSHRHSEDAENR